MTKILILTTMLISFGAFSSEYAQLKKIAEKSLNDNIIKLENGSVLRAGAHQFASLWTRDFCFASRGLWKIGREDVIKRHLNFLLDNLSDDGLVPRVLDSKKSWKRVVRYSLLPGRRYSKPVKDDLKAEYLGEHGTVAIDSNALVMIVAKDYFDKTNDMVWWNSYKNKLKAVLDFYQSKFENGLIQQEKYGDWQDSVKREGTTFFTNFLVWKAMSIYQSYAFFEIKQHEVDNLKIKILKTFFDQKSGLFKSLSKGEWISLEGNLYALEDKFFLNYEEKKDLYQNLVQSKLWNVIPGIPTVPDYPKKQISYTTKLVGLRHYHDGFTWPWLTAFSAKISGLMGDSTTQRFLMEKLQEWAIRDNAIHEVLNPKKDFRPVRKPFYRSESPFSWASGFVLDSLSSDAPLFTQ